MGFRHDIAHYCDISIDSDNHEDLVNLLSGIPLDGTCKLEVTHASYCGAHADPLTTPVMRGWSITIKFRTLYANSWKSATYDACERMARQTLDKSAVGWTTDLFTQKFDDPSEDGVTTFERMMFEQTSHPPGSIQARLKERAEQAALKAKQHDAGG